MNFDDMFNEMVYEMALNEMLMDIVKDDTDDWTPNNVTRISSVGVSTVSKAKRVLNGLLTDDFIALFGNETVENEEQLIELLESVDTGVEDNLIQLKMIADGCPEKVAITRLAVELNLQPEGEIWFKKQMEIVENNMQLLENLEVIAEKYPRLYSKLYSGEKYTVSYKCLEFLMAHLKERLEYLGVFFKSSKNANVFAPATFHYVATRTSCNYGTVRNNVSTLDKAGLVRKLTDKEVMDLSLSYYIERKKYKTNSYNKSTTTYLLIEWTEDVLESANDFLAGTRQNKTGQRGTTYQTEKARGNETTLSKVSDKKMSEKDKEAMASLRNWARQKINKKTGAHFFTKADFESRFNNKDKKGTIHAGKVKQTTYLKLLVAQLDLVAIQPTKANKAALEPYLSSKVNNVDYRKDIFISRELFERINETINLPEKVLENF